MTTSKAFLDVGLAERDKCILCNSITDDRYVKIKNDGLTTLNQLADRWQALDDRLCTEYPYDEFKQAKNRIPSEIGTEDVVAHSTCRVTFRTRIKRKEEQNEKLEPLPVADCDVDEATSTNPNLKISRKKGRPKLLCFVCNEETDYDQRQYNKGGLGRCSELLSANKLQSQMRAKLLQENDKFYEAAKRLNIILSGAVCDIFAADIYYHKKCYANFVYSYEIKPSEEEKKIIEEEITNNFLRKFILRAIEAKEAFLITELLKDVGEISEEYGLKEAPITLKHTYQVKAKLIEQFGDRIEFGKVGRSDVVYPSGANPLQYSLATLHGRGLREDDLVKALAKLVNRKLSGKERQSWPPDPKELLSSLDNSGPLRCLYNAISWSINPKREKNELGYAKTASESQAEKIAAIAECWERLITNERTPTATALSLTLHRVTGSKEATKLLHHCGMGISYTDVRLLTNKWAQAISMDHKKMLPPGFTTGRSVHITFDNSDGKQQTITGDHTTHHTTGTVFQMRQPKETQVVIDNEKQPILTDEGEDEFNYGHYKIPKKRASPPSFPEFEDIYSNTDHLKKSLHKDIAWVVVGAVHDSCIKQIYPGMDGNDMAPVGSWTAFNIDTTGVETTKCKLEYLLVVPFPPTDNIIKWYMNMIMQMADDLQIEHIFAHADEAIYSKMLMISWLHKGEYDKIVPLIGGFHTVMSFNALLRCKMENENHSFNEALTTKLADLRCEPSAAALQLVTEDTCFQMLYGPARHMKSGQEIHQSVVDGLLASSSVGEIAYLEFVNTRIKAPNNRHNQAVDVESSWYTWKKSTYYKYGADYAKRQRLGCVSTQQGEQDRVSSSTTDTRIILEVSKSNRPVVVKAADTDILVLMCYAFSACQPVEEWMMKIDSDRYASISCIQNHFGHDVCSILPAYHSIAGCDTTSFPYGAGKTKPFKKMVKTKSNNLLSDLGSNDKSFEDISKAVKFFHEIIYNGNSKESITETGPKMYQKQKTKSSSSLIPDESSVAEHVKRSDLQTLIWKQCLLQNIVTPTLENRGWKEENNEIMPVWYTGNQLPPCLNKKAQKVAAKWVAANLPQREGK
eukprot:gene18600-20470_t